MNKQADVYAAICVYSNQLSCDEMVEILNYIPSTTSEKRGKKNRKYSVCTYSTLDELESSDLRNHLSFLIIQLND